MQQYWLSKKWFECELNINFIEQSDLSLLKIDQLINKFNSIRSATIVRGPLVWT